MGLGPRYSVCTWCLAGLQKDLLSWVVVLVVFSQWPYLGVRLGVCVCFEFSDQERLLVAILSSATKDGDTEAQRGLASAPLTQHVRLGGPSVLCPWSLLLSPEKR